MSGTKKLVLLAGSPKNRGGTSLVFGEHLIDKLPKDRFKSEIFHLVKAVKKDEDWNKVEEAVFDADTVILSFPLYWDSMPSHVIRAMERLYLTTARKRFLFGNEIRLSQSSYIADIDDKLIEYTKKESEKKKRQVEDEYQPTLF